MLASVSIWIPPAGSSDGSTKLLIVTPGNPLNAAREMSLVSDTLLKMVPRASTCSLSVEMVHVNEGLCKRKTAKFVNLMY